METFKQLNVPIQAHVMKALKEEAQQRGMLLYAIIQEILANAVATAPLRNIKRKAS